MALEHDEVALSLDHVQAYYGESHVLHGVSFSLRRSRVLALLGRNGAGKTTSMNVAIGWLSPREGQVKVYGQDLTRQSPEAISRAGVGLVPQGRRVFPNLTVRENLIVAAQPDRFGMSRPWDLERVHELFPRLRERMHQTAGSLSGGERNRLLLAKLFAQPSNLLVTDEPTNDLDVETLRALEDALLEFPGNTFVISHDRWFLDRIATHMLAFEGDSHVEWFEGNFADYEEDKKRRLGTDSTIPKRIKYKKLTR